MKKYIAIMVAICLVLSTATPGNSLLAWAVSQIEHTEESLSPGDTAELGNVDAEDDFGDEGAESNGETDTSDGGGEIDVSDGDGDIETKEPDELDDSEKDNGELDSGTEDDLEDINKDDEEIIFEKDAVYLDIYVDEYRNVDINASSGIRYYVVDDFGRDDNYEACDIVVFFGTDEGIVISEDDIWVTIPFEWSYEIDMDHYTIIISPYSEDVLTVKSPKVYIAVDEARNVSVTAIEGIGYKISDKGDEGILTITLLPESHEITISEEDIVVHVPEGWIYEIDVANLTVNVVVLDQKEFTFDELVEMGVIEIVQPNPRLRTHDDVERILIIHDNARASSWLALHTAISSSTQNATLWTEVRLTSSFGSTLSYIALDVSGGRRIRIVSSEAGVARTLWQETVTNQWGAVNRRHFIISGGAQLEIRDIILNGNSDASLFRGGIDVSGSGSRFAMLQGSAIQNCSANHGGAIRATGGAAVDLQGGIIRNNIVSPDHTGANIHLVGLGGGVHVRGNNTTLTTTNVQITGNDAPGLGFGGGIDVYGGASATIGVGTVISGNTAGHSAGGIHIWGGMFAGETNRTTVTMNGGEISGNFAQMGAGVRLHVSGGYLTDESVFTMNGGKITGNIASVYGGGIAGDDLSTTSATFLNQSINILRGEISGNTAETDGGGIWIRTGTLNITGGEIRGNTAQNGGGGINAAGTSRLNIEAGTISDNTADDGGGLYVPHLNLSNVDIAEQVVFSGNKARNGVKIDCELALRQISRINPGTLSLFWVGGFVHAFTNYDINAEGPPLAQVIYDVGSGEGDIFAKTSINGFEINSGDFVIGGTEIIFTSESNQLFEQWDIFTKANMDDDFIFIRSEEHVILIYTIDSHTHVIGHFFESLTTLTVSKIVRGAFSNTTDKFAFTITFKDFDGRPLEDAQFSYIGDTLDGFEATAPPDGTLYLDSSGSATFWLKHGQSITIENVPLNGFIQITEETDGTYIISFVDSENENITVFKNDTGMMEMTEDRKFLFIGDREAPPAMGVNIGYVEGMFMIVIGFVLLFTMMLLVILRRLRVAKKHPIGCIG